MSVIPQTPELPGGLAPLVPCQGSALDPLGTLSGPQTPRLLTPPLTTNPGSAPGSLAQPYWKYVHITEKSYKYVGRRGRDRMVQLPMQSVYHDHGEVYNIMW
jgi:hypothetical protein